ncbi:MOSC domain-containing protein YiiM [Murinocardiopsis flavida]|uniref:MOSC domain-containing protein YiiM n=1 Tax=Murinocardiopsis flavida TaxID=645275 RepID=A0A2P8DUR5_9ACTN|nr:MOSC domain-containing protein [Murinocardiopsis flavida]PSL00956.1 MOSC domain-containing protein YiiM [Murinocardiopsis flavida]
MGMALVGSVNVGTAVDADWAGRLKRTAIDKRPAPGRVAVHTLGLDGDEQADLANHGGPDQAVYAYAREELDLWSERLGRPLRDGVFGENLTTTGLEVSRARIGERWRIGSALLEVTVPRTPCSVFKAWLDDEPGWVKRFSEEARTGAYLRVVEEGEVAAGDPVITEYRPDHGIDLTTAFRAGRDNDLDLLERVLAIPGRSDKWRPVADQVRRRRAAGPS